MWTPHFGGQTKTYTITLRQNATEKLIRNLILVVKKNSFGQKYVQQRQTKIEWEKVRVLSSTRRKVMPFSRDGLLLWRINVLQKTEMFWGKK